MFEQMTRSISEDALSLVLRAKLQQGQKNVRREKVAEATAAGFEDDGGGDAGAGAGGAGSRSGRRALRSSGGGGRGGAASAPVQAKRVHSTGRNDPCPCGSGKKYKNCHGAVA
jgi:preprotein translocase subunit SecA